MYKQLPNQLTLLRLLLAAAFFVVLNQYRYQTQQATWILPVAIGVFILAALTDLLDGFLARRWRVESTFGRIMDPFCDKVLIIGSFIYLAGPRFVNPTAVEHGSFFTMTTGVYPWMVAVILARELLVTGIRGELEGHGVQFGANIFGKLKMVLQSVTIPVILLLVYLLDPTIPPAARSGAIIWVRRIFVYATVIATVLSGIPYVTRALAVMRSRR